MLNYGRILYHCKPVALRLSPHEKAQDAARLSRSIGLSRACLSIVAVFAAPGPLHAPASVPSGTEAFMPLARSWREIQAPWQFSQMNCGNPGPFSLLLPVLSADPSQQSQDCWQLSGGE